MYIIYIYITIGARMEGYILWFWAAARCAWLRPPDSAAPRWPRDDSSRSSRGSPVGMVLVYI